MKAVGVIRLGFQFMVGLLCKKTNQQMLIKVFPMVGTFMRLSLVYNESWADIADFNKTSEDATPQPQQCRWADGQMKKCSQNFWFSLVSGWATLRTGKRQQAGIALSSFLLCEIQNCCCKWGCTVFKWGLSQVPDRAVLGSLGVASKPRHFHRASCKTSAPVTWISDRKMISSL